jgi:type I restriction enzyme S subunit
MKTAQLEDVLDTLIDYRGKTPTKTESGVRLITAKVIKDGFVNDSSYEYIAESEYDAWMRRGLPKRWDLLVTTEAPLGEVALLRGLERVALAQRVILLRADPRKMDQRYLFQAFKSPFVQGELAKRATGTTVLGIKQSELRQILVPQPPLPIQRRIADILSAYDDLIENNTKRIKILEEMARSLYREWFVNFRFPGHEKVKMVSSRLGKLPEGWAATRLGDVAVVNERSIRRGAEPEYIDYVDISAVSPGRIENVQRYAFAEAPGRARRLVRHGDTIWSMVRPNHRAHVLILRPADSLVASTGFAVITPKKAPSSFTYLALTTDEFVAHLVNHARGAAYPAVTGEDFEAAPFLMPDLSVLERFDALVGPLLEQRHVLTLQDQVLSDTRDLLLPRLISGEVQVDPTD